MKAIRPCVLITGAAGQIAKAAAQNFKEKDISFIALPRTSLHISSISSIKKVFFWSYTDSISKREKRYDISFALYFT